jgi:hypothetical protein
MKKGSSLGIIGACLLLASACAKSDVHGGYQPPVEPQPQTEICDGINNDLDGEEGCVIVAMFEPPLVETLVLVTL